MQTVRALYSENLTALGLGVSDEALKKHQDVVDAMLIGRLALTRVRAAVLAGVPTAQEFATAAPRARGGVYRGAA